MFSAKREKLTGASRAFTLVELLVVVGIISVLMAILLPVLKQARQAAQAAQCLSNLRQIGMAIRLYTMDNKGWTHWGPNYGLWELPRGTPLSPESERAYWGTAYLPYVVDRSVLQITPGKAGSLDVAAMLDKPRSLWNCPSSLMTDIDPGYSDVMIPANIGLNYFITNKKLDRFKKWEEMIIAQDSWEHLIEGNGDLLTNIVVDAENPLIVHREATNITQYRGNKKAQLAVQEYYRHTHKCNVLWMDGHCSQIHQSDGSDIPIRWYTGVEPVNKY